MLSESQHGRIQGYKVLTSKELPVFRFLPVVVTETMVPFCSFQIFREEKNVLICLGTIITVFYIIMDIILYTVLQDTVLSVPQTLPGHAYSPFYPLTMKLIMTDPTSHYVIKPTSEIFNQVTGFSTVFFFVTANMISFSHVIIALIAGKFIASECIRDRRFGLILFEFRTWLDGLDGVVFRSRAKDFAYHSHRNSSGYYIDLLCDTIGGFALSTGALFYLFKYFEKKAVDVPLWTKNGTNGSTNGHTSVPSKKLILWKIFCYGILIGLSSKCWDMLVDQMEGLFEKPINDAALTALQTSTLHSWFTWCIILFWRLLQGQQLLQYLVVAVCIDKIWEFINFVQYLGYVVIISLALASYAYIQYVKYLLHL
ncbi:ceramide phosphoethanolamine synthase-like [Haliotis rubra]|uniref:ceramide phosphoethanolamine synthase-like n=1 Tax=Haliotis rubra TaxID=36100 RepID=UPI001EE5D4F1|nr:ceramide phosphoethanolamine synthase-like [Haliotis rubra]